MTNNKKPDARITHGTADPADVQSRLAVLIDADNASAAIIDGLFAEIAKYGVASVKRIYNAAARYGHSVHNNFKPSMLWDTNENRSDRRAKRSSRAPSQSVISGP